LPLGLLFRTSPDHSSINPIFVTGLYLIFTGFPQSKGITGKVNCDFVGELRLNYYEKALNYLVQNY
jgi:hypothetical protein